MWYYKLNNKKYSNGLWKVPNNCISNNRGRFKEILLSEYEHKRSERNTIILKSAVLSWFGDKYKDEWFSINMNGYESIILQRNNFKLDELHFYNYSVEGQYIVYTNNYLELLQIRKLLHRKFKIEKLCGIIN
jgi:hypothetical protein